MPVETAAQSGVLTFLFTDIVGSTSRWAEDRSAMGSALAEHDQTIERAVEAGGGRVFKHTGDGICAVFGSPAAAIAAARSAQDALALPVRMGVHVGESEQRDGDFFGPTLNMCARIMDAGHGGQVLLSAAAAAMVDGVEVRELGEFPLKGLPGRQRIFQVGGVEFPPLRVSEGDSLPRSLSSLVGRDDLIADVVTRLASERLVTLVGVGGVGKTRVALAAADRARSHFDRVVFADMGLVGDEADVVPALARSLGVPSASAESVVLSLSSQPVLLLVDNCEHVLAEVADVLDTMLQAAPEATVLATSRESLALPGEVIVAVPGLDGHGPNSSAVQLFADRAHAVAPGFEVTASNEVAVQDLCRRLDHLPLAIELAAARVTTLSPAELLSRLDDRFSILTGGRRRRRRDRHQTLRDTIDWSYELLDPVERKVFTRLAAFGGPFDLDAAAAVNPDLAEMDVLDVLGSLVDKSLLTVDRVERTTRYRYLETIRAYAEAMLDESSELPEVMRHLHGHLVDLLDRVLDDRWTDNWSTSAPRMRANVHNYRRALDHCLAGEDLDGAARLLAPRAQLLTLAYFAQGIDGWAMEVLDLPGAGDHPDRQALLALQAMDLHFAGRFGQLNEACDTMLAAEGASSPWWAQWIAGFYYQVGGRHEAALAAATAAIGAASSDGDEAGLVCRMLFDMTTFVEGVPSEGDVDRIQDDLRVGQAHPSPFVRAWASWCRAWQARSEGDYDSMLAAARAALDNSVESIGLNTGAAFLLGWAQIGLGRPHDAIRTASSTLELVSGSGQPSEYVGCIGLYTMAMRELDEPRTAAVTRGWLPPRLTFLFSREFPLIDRWLDANLDADELAELKAEGRAMAPDQLRLIVEDAASRHTA